MPFAPWREHHVVDGWCLDCSLRIPISAVIEGKAYSHGDRFSTDPKGRVVRCSDKR
jgi:hypothetical protein